MGLGLGFGFGVCGTWVPGGVGVWVGERGGWCWGLTDGKGGREGLGFPCGGGWVPMVLGGLGWESDAEGGLEWVCVWRGGVGGCGVGAGVVGVV